MTAITDKAKLTAFEGLFRAYLGEENHDVLTRRVAGQTLKKIATDLRVSVPTIHGRMQRVKLKLVAANIKLDPAVERML